MTGRNEPPLAPRRQHGPDRIEHPSRVRRPGAAPLTLSRDQRSDHHPLRVRQIVLPIIMQTAMLRSGGLGPSHGTLHRRCRTSRQDTTARGHPRLQEQTLNMARIVSMAMNILSGRSWKLWKPGRRQKAIRRAKVSSSSDDLSSGTDWLAPPPGLVLIDGKEAAVLWIGRPHIYRLVTAC